MASEPTDPTEPTPAVHRSVEVEATPDEVWELLVDDDERGGWFGGETALDAVPGGSGWFTDPDGTRRAAVVEESTPGRRLAWTWWPDDDSGDGSGDCSRVDIDLTPTPGGTHISVTETPLVPTTQASIATSATGPLLDLEFRILARAHAPSITCRR